MQTMEQDKWDKDNTDNGTGQVGQRYSLHSGDTTWPTVCCCQQDKWDKGTHCRPWNGTSGEKVLTVDHGTGQVGKRYSLQTMEKDKWDKGTHCRQWNRTSGEKVLTADHGTGQVGIRYSLQTMEQDKWGEGTHCRPWNRTSREKILTADSGTGQVGRRYSLQTMEQDKQGKNTADSGTGQVGEKVLTADHGTGQAGEKYSLQTVEQDKWGEGTHCRPWNRTSKEKYSLQTVEQDKWGKRYSLQTMEQDKWDKGTPCRQWWHNLTNSLLLSTGHVGKRYWLTTVEQDKQVKGTHCKQWWHNLTNTCSLLFSNGIRFRNSGSFTESKQNSVAIVADSHAVPECQTWFYSAVSIASVKLSTDSVVQSKPKNGCILINQTGICTVLIHIRSKHLPWCNTIQNTIVHNTINNPTDTLVHALKTEKLHIINILVQHIPHARMHTVCLTNCWFVPQYMLILTGLKK